MPTVEASSALRRAVHLPTEVDVIPFTQDTAAEVKARLTGWGVAWFPMPSGTLKIATPQSVKPVRFGDWVVRGVVGEVWPISDAVYRRSYRLKDEG